MTFERLAPAYAISVDVGGSNHQDLTPVLGQYITHVSYESIDGAADMAKISLANPGGIWTDSKDLMLGNELNIFMGYHHTLEFIGRVIISKVSHVFDQGIPTMEITGYTKDCLMMDTAPKTTRTGDVENKREGLAGADISALLRSVARGYNMQLNPTNVPPILYRLATDHPQKLTESDYDYVSKWANFLSCIWWVEGTKEGKWHLYFFPPAKSRDLEYPIPQVDRFDFKYDMGVDSNLMKFEPEQTLRNRLQKVSVTTRGYNFVGDFVFDSTTDVETRDSKLPQDTKGRGNPSDDKIQRELDPAGRMIKIIFGEEVGIQVMCPITIHGQQAILRWARNWVRKYHSSFVTASGQTVGDPRFKARQIHNVLGVGKGLSGRYYFSRVRHVFDQNGYMCEFDARKLIE